MTQNMPKTTKQWIVTSQDGKDGFNALKFSEEQLHELGDSQVLVKRTFSSQATTTQGNAPLIPFVRSPCCVAECELHAEHNAVHYVLTSSVPRFDYPVGQIVGFDA